MEKRRNTNRRHHKQRPYSQDDGSKKIVQELMEKYGMDEAAALEIIHGVLSLEQWQRKHKASKTTDQARQVSTLLLQPRFTPRTTIAILKAVYALPQYQKQKGNRLANEKQAIILAEKENIPVAIAKKIVAGSLTLEEYQAQEQQKKERREKAIDIHQKYPELPLNVCYQIVDEKIEVQEFLERRTIRKQKRQNWYLSYLQNHQQENLPLSLYLQKLHNKKIKTFFTFFGHDSQMGTIIGYTPYNLKIKDRDGNIATYAKLKMKYFCRASYVHKVLSLLTFDPQWRDNQEMPNPDPEQRYQIPNEILQEGNLVEVTLGGGEVFKGLVNWASSYDIKLLVSAQPKASVVVFRHAVVAAKLLAEKIG